MTIVIAPDSVQECLSASQVAEAIAYAAKERWPEATVVQLPLADGGEGTLEVLAGPMGLSINTITVHDPLGRAVQARYGVAGETAVVEVAEACGLHLLAKAERNPMVASSQGVGELLMDAYGKGSRRFIIGLGGTATCDGGSGMMGVTGIREALRECSVEFLCDVTAPFVGPYGAARVFAPQKGASPEQVELLEERLMEVAQTIMSETGVDIASIPGAGAAGGIAGALMAYSNAHLCSGIERIMELCGFHRAITGASLIITGEGKSDSQTLMGKVPYGVLKHSAGVPVALLSGRIEQSPALLSAGFRHFVEISPRSISLDDAINPATALKNIKTSVLNLRVNDMSHHTIVKNV